MGAATSEKARETGTMRWSEGKDSASGGKRHETKVKKHQVIMEINRQKC